MTVRADALDPAIDLPPIAPNDNENLPKSARAIRCRGDGTAGTVRVTTAVGEVRDTYIMAGEMLIVQVMRVHATGTTATGLEAIV